MIRTLHSFLLLCCILLVISCQQEVGLQPQDGTSLVLRLKTDSKNALSRGVQDLNDDGTISNEELYVDGQKIYRLGVFLLNNGSVVTSTVLESGDTRFTNNNTEAVISFENLDYSKTYEIYAVANYGDFGMLQGNISNVSSENIVSGLKVFSSENNICPQNVVYPLTLKQQVKLTPGTNTIAGQLLRTCARLRINVRNHSNLNNLYITKLDFPTNFTQKSADLFVEGGTAAVSPEVTSTDAITPYVKDMEIGKITGDGIVNEATIFDAYLLESNGGNYNYTLGLRYIGDSKVDYAVSSSAITNHNNIEDGAMYVIYHNSTKQYLVANGDKVDVGTSYLTDGKLNHNYAWRFKKTGTNMYTIESMGASGYFMQSSNIDGNRIPLTVNATSTDYFTASTSSNTIRFKSTSSRYGYAYYMAVNNKTVCGNTSSHGYYLYKVETKSEATNITHEASNIPIHVVDKTTGESSPLTSIRRNDLIDILVNVTYNEKTDDIEYEVSAWDNVNGEVTFD